MSEIVIRLNQEAFNTLFKWQHTQKLSTRACMYIHTCKTTGGGALHVFDQRKWQAMEKEWGRAAWSCGFLQGLDPVVLLWVVLWLADLPIQMDCVWHFVVLALCLCVMDCNYGSRNCCVYDSGGLLLWGSRLQALRFLIALFFYSFCWLVQHILSY